MATKRFTAALLATSLVAAILGAGGTYLGLESAGAFDPHATAAPSSSGGIQIESDSSALIAAAKKAAPAVVQIMTNDGIGDTRIGAGVIFDVRGWIVTNKHLVNGALSITIRLSDDRRVTGKVYGQDTLSDLAIIKMEGVVDLTAAQMGVSADLRVGQTVVALGSPEGLAYPNSASAGIVSALHRSVSYPLSAEAGAPSLTFGGLIQTDAAINPGSSGGPLLDEHGLVIGIVNAGDTSAAGMGFAIPIDTVIPILAQALAGEPLARPYLGMNYLSITAGVKTDYNLPLGEGAWVHREDDNGTVLSPLATNGPADKAGVQPGDIVTEIAGHKVDADHRLEDWLVALSPGQTIDLRIYRGGAYITLSVTLGTRPAAGA